MSLHSDTLSWFQANQSLLFLLFYCCVLSEETTNTNIIVLCLNPRSAALEHDYHYTTDVVLWSLKSIKHMFTDTAELKFRDRNYIYNSQTTTNPIVIYGSSPIKVRFAAMIKSDWFKRCWWKQTYHTVGTCPTSYRKIVETRNKIDTSNTHIHDLSIFYWLGSGIAIKSCWLC